MDDNRVVTRLRVLPVSDANPDLIATVGDLADRHRRTLGFLPRSVLQDHARRGWLHVAMREGTLVGYALFALARDRVRLIHLCVGEPFRGTGAARALVEAVAREHSSLRGLSVKCRKDYDAASIWRGLGFTYGGEAPGRGQDQAPLEIWHRSNGNPDLLSGLLDEDRPLVAIDHNIFVDLVIEPAGAGAEESQVLVSDWVEGEVTVARTRISANEIRGISDPILRSRQLARLDHFPELRVDHDREQELWALWRARFPALPDRDRTDIEHVICAAAGGASVLVTRDHRLRERYGEAARKLVGVRLLSPSALLVRLDEMRDRAAYSPASLAGTSLRSAAMPADEESRVLSFIDTAGRETKTALRARVQKLLLDPAVRRRCVLTETGDLAAAWAIRTTTEHGVLEVPLLRAGTTLAPTISRQITFALRRDAVEANCREVRVVDPHVGRAVRGALAEDGFVSGHHGEQLAAVLDVRSTEEALRALPEAGPLREKYGQLLTGEPSRIETANLEHSLWPARLLDLELPCYIVPIRPEWATSLLGLDQLLARDDVLGLSREHVYFKSPRNSPAAPARIAWYESRNARAIVAVSSLVEVATGSPDDLYSRFQRLGVYRREDVHAVAAGGVAAALRFADTQLLRPVNLERVRGHSSGRQIGTIQSRTAISAELYGWIYEEGRGRHD